MRDTRKPIRFVGSSLDDLKAWPEGPRRQGGHQLDRVQQGLDPNDWKPMKSIGPGVREIRIADDGEAYRILYLAKRADAVYVLHCFEKKTRSTAKADIDKAKARLKQLPEPGR
jgi:phage-related protein